ncbi:hypothetical protein [Streptomyces sp. NPDC017949]|uniref:hypothetical protein n=1 Tax=Streptomyces sp. NPDC017949 TaxID=3365020 RepID=UPI0037A10A83
MDIVEGALIAIAAGFTGVASLAALKTAKTSDHNSQTANRIAELAARTAESAAQIAESVAQIERDRWHRELTPEVSFRVTEERGHLELLIRYGGPSSLGTLTSLELRVRDDRDRSNDQLLAGGPTAEEHAKTIHGPYRFRHSTNGSDEIGRSVAPFSLPPGEAYRLALDPTHPPRYYAHGRDHWERDWRNHDFRLWVDCHVEGHKPWNLTADIPHTLGSLPEAWTSAR